MKFMKVWNVYLNKNSALGEARRGCVEGTFITLNSSIMFDVKVKTSDSHFRGKDFIRKRVNHSGQECRRLKNDVDDKFLTWMINAFTVTY